MNPLSLAPDSLYDLISRLTPRQMEIVSLLAEGKSAKETGAILSISRATVLDHIRKARIKTGSDNRIQLIVIYTMWRVMN